MYYVCFRRLVTRCNETNLCNGNDDEEEPLEGGGSAILIEGKDSGASLRPAGGASLLIAAMSTMLWMRLR